MLPKYSDYKELSISASTYNHKWDKMVKIGQQTHPATSIRRIRSLLNSGMRPPLTGFDGVLLALFVYDFYDHSLEFLRFIKFILLLISSLTMRLKGHVQY